MLSLGEWSVGRASVFGSTPKVFFYILHEACPQSMNEKKKKNKPPASAPRLGAIGWRLRMHHWGRGARWLVWLGRCACAVGWRAGSTARALPARAPENKNVPVAYMAIAQPRKGQSSGIRPSFFLHSRTRMVLSRARHILPNKPSSQLPVWRGTELSTTCVYHHPDPGHPDATWLCLSLL